MPSKQMAPGKLRFSFCGQGLGLNRLAAERQLIARRCRYTRLGVYLDGVLASRRQAVSLVDDVEPSSGKPAKSPVILDEREIGVIGYARDPEIPAATRIVNRGVTYIDSNLTLEGVQVLVEVDLPMDLSREKLYLGPELAAVRTAIRAARTRIAEPVREAAKREQARKANEFGTWKLILSLCVFTIFGVIAAVLDHRQEAQRARYLQPIEHDYNHDHNHIYNNEYESPNHDPFNPPQTPEARPAPDPDPALQLHEPYFRRLCTRDTSEGCGRYLELVRARVARDGDRDSLRQALVRACYSLAGPACLEAAWYYHYGFVVDEPADLPKTSAAQLLDRGCEAGLTRACKLRNAASLREDCEADYALACYALGLAGYDRKAASQSPDDALTAEARVHLDRACELELVEGCYAAGVARLRGLGIAEKLEDAEYWFSRGCVRRHRPSCDAERFVVQRRAMTPSQRPMLGPKDPSFPSAQAPWGAVAWTP